MNPRIEELLVQVDSKFTLVTLAPAGPADQRLLQPARRGPRLHRAAAGHLGGPQAAVDRLRGDRRRQDRRRSDVVPDELDVEQADAAAESTAPVDRPTSATHAMNLAGRRVVLGVTGGIAAYKAVEVCRRLVDAGAHVAPIMTEGAAPLRRARPRSRRWPPSRCRPRCGDERRPDPAHPARPGRRPGRGRAGHRPAARRLRRGHLRRPAHRHAARHPGAGASCARRCTPRCGSTPRCRTTSPRCARRGVHVVRARRGPPGRRRRRRRPPGRPEPTSWPRSSGPRPAAHDLAGLRVLVTAGGTREPIDPVRFIGNRSSGKQGHAIAAEAAARGAPGHPGHHRRAARARRASRSSRSRPPPRCRPRCMPSAADADVIVMAAAVADFRPVAVADHKLKKDERAVPEHRASSPPPDILADLGRAQAPRPDRSSGSPRRPTTSRPTPRDKLARKSLDLIVANDVGGPRRRLRARHQRRRASSAPTARTTMSPWPTSGPSPRPCSMPSWLAATPLTTHEPPSPDRPSASKEHA